MKGSIVNSYRLIFAFLMMVSLSACALTGGPIDGMVLEDETDKPIAGAIVVVRWRGDLPGFADSSTVCYHVESTLTDEAGRYRIAKWKKKPDPERDWERRIVNKVFGVSAYKVGYGFTNKRFREKQEIVYMGSFEGTAEERLKYLLRISGATRCTSAGESAINRLPFQKAIYEEANAIARTREEKRTVEILLFGLESQKYGSMEALERLTERRKSGR